jgi:hypothetical protein
MDTQGIKFAETIKRSRQMFDPRCLFVSCGMFICFMWDVYLFHVGCLFVSCGVNGLPSTIKKIKNTPAMI